MMMKMIRANWVDLAQGCGVVAGIFLAIHLITAGCSSGAIQTAASPSPGSLCPRRRG